MKQKIQSAPTIIYPESDGKPMAETDKHRDLMVDCIQTLQHHLGMIQFMSRETC